MKDAVTMMLMNFGPRPAWVREIATARPAAVSELSRGPLRGMTHPLDWPPPAPVRRLTPEEYLRLKAEGR